MKPLNKKIVDMYYTLIFWKQRKLLRKVRPNYKNLNKTAKRFAFLTGYLKKVKSKDKESLIDLSLLRMYSEMKFWHLCKS